jgi:hypothetical protein
MRVLKAWVPSKPRVGPDVSLNVNQRLLRGAGGGRESSDHTADGSQSKYCDSGLAKEPAQMGIIDRNNVIEKLAAATT